MKKQILILIFLTIPALSFASTDLRLQNLKIPSEIGIVQEVFEAQSESSDTKKIIIQIQDAHCNYEAQKNTIRILEQLIKENNLRLILVEGGSGDVSLSFLREYADKKKRQEVADDYLRCGEISGEEYLDIVSEYDIELYGIEDESLYDENMNSFLQFDSLRQQGIGELEGLIAAATALKPYIYSEQLSELEAQKKEYNQKDISLTDYCRYLRESAVKNHVDISDKKEFVDFLETAGLEKRINLKSTESQRNECIRALAKALDEAGVKELIARTGEFKDKKVSQDAYYSFLKEKAAGKIDISKDYPALDSYIRYIDLNINLSARGLLKEIGLIEQGLKECLFANNDQRLLCEIEGSLGLLSKLLSLELTPEEYEDFRKKKESLVTAGWINFLLDNCRRFDLGMRPAAAAVVDGNLDEFEGFYRLGIEREKAFVRNIVNKMEESRDQVAVVIAGGFHTPGISRMLKGKGYSYAIVTPAVTGKSDNNIYFSVLRGQQYTGLEEFSEEEDYEPWEE